MLLRCSWLTFEVVWADAVARVYLVLAKGASHEVVDDRQTAVGASGAAHECGFVVWVCHYVVI